MKIDMGKCYAEMEMAEPGQLSMVGPFVRQQIDRYVQAYHEQLMEQLADRHISHLCLAHGLTNEAAKAPAEPPEPCGCAGRKRLMGLNMLYYDTRAQLWFRSSKKDGRVPAAFCPLCDKRLP